MAMMTVREMTDENTLMILLSTCTDFACIYNP